MTAAQSRPAGQVARDLCVTLADVRLPRRHASGSGGRRVIIIGGGTFGAILAAELYRRMDGALSQVTVLEDGPFLFSDHVQNLPTPGLHVPPPTIRHLDLYEQEGKPRHEVWHLPSSKRCAITSSAAPVTCLAWTGCGLTSSGRWARP